MDTPLRKARRTSGQTLATVAGALGITKGTLSRIETGQIKPSPAMAEQLAKHLGTVSEIEILYPERFLGHGEDEEGQAA